MNGEGDELDPREAARLLRSDRAGGAAAVQSEPAVGYCGHGRRGPGRVWRVVVLDPWATSIQRSEPRRGRACVRGGGGRNRRVGEGLPARDRRRQRAAERQQHVEGVAILVSFVLGSPVLQGAMKHQHASHAIVYGVIPAAAPLIIVGTTVLGIAASKADWPQFGAALAVVITGVVAAFVGPSGAWLAAGIGLSIALVGYAAADALRHPRVPLRA